MSSHPWVLHHVCLSHLCRLCSQAFWTLPSLISPQHSSASSFCPLIFTLSIDPPNTRTSTHSHTCLPSSTVIGLYSHWMAEWPLGLSIIRKLLSFSPFWFPPDVPRPHLQLFKVHLFSAICFFSGFTVILRTSSSMNPFVVLKWTVLFGWTSSPLVISA